MSGGYQRDSSAITVVDSYSTKVAAEFNCNYISPNDLAAVIFEIVTKYMPNAVVNIERNGGYGSSVIAKLLMTSIKSNLFYTIKDKVVEERMMGAQVVRKKQKTKIYGSDSTHEQREKLMDILRNRVEFHKDKIISKTIYDELCGLEVKKNGRIEHSTNTHDDQVFSWLWALYIYYEGGDLVNNWGIQRRTLRTDADLEEAVYDIEDPKENISLDLSETYMEDEVENQLKYMDQAPGKMLYADWLKSQYDNDMKAMQKILSTKEGREAYAEYYHVPIESLNGENEAFKIPDEVFLNFNKDDTDLAMDQVDRGNLFDIYSRI